MDTTRWQERSLDSLGEARVNLGLGLPQITGLFGVAPGNAGARPHEGTAEPNMGVAAEHWVRYPDSSKRGACREFSPRNAEEAKRPARGLDYASGGDRCTERFVEPRQDRVIRPAGRDSGVRWRGFAT
jgi:hypothetical protein